MKDKFIMGLENPRIMQNIFKEKTTVNFDRVTELASSHVEPIINGGAKIKEVFYQRGRNFRNVAGAATERMTGTSGTWAEQWKQQQTSVSATCQQCKCQLFRVCKTKPSKSKCFYKNYFSNRCKLKGHLANMCT